jgi:hypothetical protein
LYIFQPVVVIVVVGRSFLDNVFFSPEIIIVEISGDRRCLLTTVEAFSSSADRQAGFLINSIDWTQGNGTFGSGGGRKAASG